MTEEKTVRVIRGQVDLRTALENAGSIAAGMPVLAERSVLYPYRAFRARCAVPTIAGAKTVSLTCLVDAINDCAATADQYETDAMPASGETRLSPKITERVAERTAWRTLTYGLGRKFRMIAAFGVRLEPAGTVYKRFWILKVGGERIMADSVTGCMHPLRASVA